MQTSTLRFAALAAAAIAFAQPRQAQAQTFSYTPSDFPPISIVAGYINKDWVTETSEGTFHENFWGEPNKRLHGMQIGVLYQPTMYFGPGLRTGLFFEACFSESDFVHDQGWDSFNESSLYLPLQVSCRIPLGEHCAISPFVGLGFNWAIAGSFREECRWNYDYEGNYIGPVGYQSYGRGQAPKRWNNQLEYGLDLQFHLFRLGFTYSRGLRDHDLYQSYETYQNKISVNLGVCIGE